MREDRWAGFIKDYEGGTLMECIINRHIDYLDIPGMIKRQKACLIEKIKERSSSHVVYDVRCWPARSSVSKHHCLHPAIDDRLSGWLLLIYTRLVYCYIATD